MTIRVAAIEVSHWHALNDAAYLRQLIAMPDVQLVAVQDSDAALVAKRAAEVGNPPVFTDYHAMLKKTRPDFVVALGRHSPMAAIANDLIDAGYPFLMEKPMGISAATGIRRGQRGETQCLCRRPAGAALQRLRRARPRIPGGKCLRPAVASLCADQSPGAAALSGLGLRLDARSDGSRRRLSCAISARTASTCSCILPAKRRR